MCVVGHISAWLGASAWPGVLAECCALWGGAEDLDRVLHTALDVNLCNKMCHKVNIRLNLGSLKSNIHLVLI